MPLYRVKAWSRLEHQPRGYVGYRRVYYQDLQRKRWWGWRTIDREIVPDWAHTYLCCYGDTGGWASKFSGLGSFGRDGIFAHHQPDIPRTINPAL